MKYTPHITQKIFDALADGQGRVRACKMAGITYETFMDWMRNKIEFSERIKKAEDVGNDKIKDLCKRRIIEDKSWQSGAWWLERSYPDEYRLRTTQENTGDMTVNFNETKTYDSQCQTNKSD